MKSPSQVWNPSYRGGTDQGCEWTPDQCRQVKSFCPYFLTPVQPWTRDHLMLSTRLHYVVSLNGTVSWFKSCGGPQGSILGPKLFIWTEWSHQETGIHIHSCRHSSWCLSETALCKLIPPAWKDVVSCSISAIWKGLWWTLVFLLIWFWESFSFLMIINKHYIFVNVYY